MNKTCILSLPLSLLGLLLLVGCDRKPEGGAITTTSSSTPSVSATAPAEKASAAAPPSASAGASANAAPPKVATSASASAASATPNPKGCIVLDAQEQNADGAPVTLEGTVIIDAAFEHPSRGQVRPFILKLSAPKCVLNGGELKSVTEIHIAPSDGLEVKPFVGKKVRLVDGAPFHSHTAWHARDIVVMTKKLVAI